MAEEGAEHLSSQSSAGGVPGIDSKVAHELSNILAAGLAAGRLVRNKAETDEVRELAEIVLRQLDRAAQLVNRASR